VGTGGAIVHLSDPQDELREIELKAAALIRSIGFSLGSTSVVSAL